MNSSSILELVFEQLLSALSETQEEVQGGFRSTAWLVVASANVGLILLEIGCDFDFF